MQPDADRHGPDLGDLVPSLAWTQDWYLRYDTLADAPEDIRSNKRYKDTGDFSIDGMTRQIEADFGTELGGRAERGRGIRGAWRHRRPD